MILIRVSFFEFFHHIQIWNTTSHAAITIKTIVQLKNIQLLAHPEPSPVNVAAAVTAFVVVNVDTVDVLTVESVTDSEAAEMPIAVSVVVVEVISTE